MSVTELHPEELFDKLAEGTLSEPERERLSIHLESCAVCRFEYAARLDFAREASATEPRAPLSVPAKPVEPALRPRQRRRSRVLVWGFAAALLISASGALASALGEPPWRAVAAMFVDEPFRPAPRAPRVVAKPASVSRSASPLSTAAPAELPAAAASVLVTPPAEVSSAGRREVPPTERAPRPPAGRPERQPSAPSGVSRAPSDFTVEKPSEAENTELVRLSAAQLFADANQARRAGQVGRASGLYHLLQEQFPGSPEAELSRVTLATLLLNAGDAAGALDGFERYLAGPSRALEAEALVGRARALERLGRRQLEATAWSEVERRFPGSVYARQATERLTALGQR